MKGGKTMIKNANELSIRPIVCTLDSTSFTWTVVCGVFVDYNLYSRETSDASSVYKKLLNIITRFRDYKSNRRVTGGPFHNGETLVA